MRFFRAIVPNLSIALDLALLVLVILDQFNPRLGLLTGLSFLLLFGAAFLCSVTTAALLYADWRKEK